MINIASPKMVRERLKYYSQNQAVEISAGDRGALVGVFNKVLEYTSNHTTETVDQRRYLVWGFCFTPDDKVFRPLRSKELEPAQFYALKKWCGFWKDDDNIWRRRDGFDAEVKQVLTLAEAFHFVIASGKGSDLLMGEMMSGLDAVEHKIIKGGMVQSSVDSMGGAVTGIMDDSPEYQDTFANQEQPDYILDSLEQDRSEPVAEPVIVEGYVPL